MPLTPFHGPPAQPPAVPGFVASTLLGLGAHGEVWAAREQITGDQVALKIGRRQAGNDSGSSESEADLLARLDHPHLVRLRRVVPMPGGGAAMVLDLAAGGSLAALLAARGPLDPGELVTLLVPLATVLAELHSNGVVHGDLAPGNVLFTGDGRPLLGDLGVSTILGTRTAREWSTPGFADPALARGGDPRAADVWSLAAVAWFALTGRPPLDGEKLDVGALDGAHGLPPELTALIRSCLSALPAERPGLEEVAERAWAAVPPRPIRLSIPGSGDETDATEPDAGPGADQVRGPMPELRWMTAPSRVAERPAAVAQRTPAVADPAQISQLARTVGGARVARLMPAPARPGRRHLVAAAAGCLLAGAAAVALQGRSAPDSPTLAAVTARRSASATLAPSEAAAATPTSGGTVTQAAITQALEQISAARARAFHRASTKPLAAADEPGSPAEQMDAALVARLAGTGVRLDGVSYRIRQVQMLAGTGDLLDVRAVVTTSGHRQVSTGGKARRIAPVGPVQVDLRLVRMRQQDPADQAGKADQPGSGWLVRSVQAVSG